MTSFNSSLAYWTKREIYPNSIFLTTSGSGGDRLLFWQPAPHVRESEARTKCKLLLNGTRPIDGYQSEGCLPVDAGLTVESNRNPFALNLITERSAGTGETSGLSTVSYTALDRLSGSCVAGGSCNVTSNHCGSGSPAAASVSGTPSAVVSCGSMVGGSGEAVETSSSSVNETSLDGGAVMGVNGLSTIEGLPTKLLLGLLHQQFQGLQRKIYIKLGPHVFVGVAFNVTPTVEESSELNDEDGISNVRTRAGKSMLSFAVVFAMDTSALPCVLSYYTELARLTATQIRRAELISDYLSQERNTIVAILEQNPAALCSDQSYGQTNLEMGNREPVTFHSSFRRSQRTGGCADNLSAPGGPTDERKRSIPDKSPVTSATDCGLDSCKPWGLDAQTIQDQLVQLSSLCGTLKQIVDSVCLTGHVNVMIDQVYPVFFCLPHKAYCLTRESMMSHTPAIRPMAIWRAMDKIRPYHALMLVHRKQHLIDHYLPKNANTNMIDFINDLSPTVSLHDLSTKIQSQSYTLSLALWLIYRGHAMIVYPIVATNIYVLSPQFAVWFSPQLIVQFASRFPSLNLAQALESFSTGLTLKEYSSTTLTRNQNGGSNQKHKPTTRMLSSTDSTQADSDSFWTQLSYATKVELITWLLRRRLIIQIHVYVFSTMNRESLLRAKQSKPSEQSFVTPGAQQSYSTDSHGLPANRPAGPSLTVDDIKRADNLCTCPSDTIQAALSLGDRDKIDNRLAHLQQSHEDLIAELRKQFPVDLQQIAVDVILNHPGATQNITLLSLFVRILSHLPAHLEELMFTLAVSRFTLIECIERFSPWLSTARLPDPVTACFSGIDWPD